MRKRILTIFLAMACAIPFFAQTGGLVLSEMLVDPKPPIALPEVEYVEVYNRSTDTLFLEGWTLRVGSKIGRISNGQVLPKAYAVLCSHTVTEQFDSLLNVIGVTAFPALNNDAATVALYDAQARPVSWFSYVIADFPDVSKREGGWALECIDTENLSGEFSNWTFSKDPSGGTPGRINSVAAVNPDTLEPKLVSWGILGDSVFTLRFNKSLNPMQSLKADCFQLFGHTIDTVVSPPPFASVLLSVTPRLNPDESLSLFISNIQCVSGMYMIDTMLDALVPAAVGEHDIVLNEVMFEVREQSEWVELYNRSEHALSLADLYLSVRDKEGAIKLHQPLSNDGQVLMPESYAVVARDFTFMNAMNLHPQNAILVGYNLPALPDVGACLVLTDSALHVIDEVCYSPSWHHPLLEDTHDISLERVSPDADSNDAANWHSASMADGGSTPGQQNSHYEDASSSAETDADWFSLDYDTFSPDGDGYRDELPIRYLLPNHGFILNANIYSPEGYLLATIAKNCNLGVSGTLVWNGKDTNGATFNTGVYVIVCEVFSSNGEHRVVKLNCVIANK